MQAQAGFTGDALIRMESGHPRTHVPHQHIDTSGPLETYSACPGPRKWPRRPRRRALVVTIYWVSMPNGELPCPQEDGPGGLCGPWRQAKDHLGRVFQGPRAQMGNSRGPVPSVRTPRPREGEHTVRGRMGPSKARCTEPESKCDVIPGTDTGSS